MNVHELPMILFTVIAQMSVGAIWTLGAIHLYGRIKKMPIEAVDRVTNGALYAAGPLLVLGFIAAFFHLGEPMHALNTLRGIGSSWQSREIALGILYGASGFVFAAAQWFGWFPRKVRDGLAIITALFGFFLVWAMAATYYSVETIPAWNTPAVFVFFFASAVLTGALAVGVALLLIWNMQSAEKPGPLTRLAQRLNLLSAEPMNADLDKLTTKALQGISLTTAIAGLVIMVTYPVYLVGLASGPEAAQEVAGRLVGPLLFVRLALLAAVVLLTGVFAFVRARSANKPNKTLAWLIVVAFVFAVATELIGRGLHYEGLWHVGLNTIQ